MAPGPAAEAADLLLAAARNGLLVERLPIGCLPRSAAEAYAIQDLVALASGPIGGWKTGLSGPGAEPRCAPIFARDIRSDGAIFDWAGLPVPALEIEFAFRIERDLPAAGRPYDREEVAGAISFLPLVEVLGSRFAAPDACTEWEALADRNANRAVVIGAPVAAWRAIDWRQLRVELSIDGVPVQSALDTHPAGDPVGLVVWQANHCVARGLPLSAGMIVTTGSLQGATPIGAGSRALARWGELGTLALAFR